MSMSDLTQQEEKHVRDADDPRLEEALVRVARMYNLLDTGWIEDRLAPNATYESQSVFDKLSGAKAVLAHLKNKTELLRKLGAEALVRAELGTKGEDGPSCVCLYQKRSSIDRSYRDHPSALVEVTLTARGEIGSVFIITCVPYPAWATRTGIFPGLTLETVWPDEPPIVLTTVGYQGVKLVLLLLNDEMSLDCELRDQVQKALDRLPGAELDTWRFDAPGFLEEPQQECIKSWGVISFPTLVVLWKDELLLHLEGTREAQDILAEISAVILVRGE